MAFFNSTAASQASEIASGRKTALSVVKESLDRIAEKDAGIVGAFITVDSERALARAAAIDAMPPAQRSVMPLAGIPIAVKDNICTKDMATTCGSAMLTGFVPPYNAGVVEALEDAGAVIVGKANMDEFAMGSSTETSHFGPTHNPADLERIPGGSSGGSVAAVAAGFVPLALGSDTGGSIRQPCSHCGVPGLKPTYGRVSRFGLVAFASSLDQIGPVAADVRDLGLLLSVISRPDNRDSTNAGKPFVDLPALYTTNLTGTTIGLPREYYAEGLHSEVRSALENVKRRLTAAGAKFVEVSLPNVNAAIATYYIICTAEASSNLARYDGVKYGYRSKRGSSLTDMYRATRSEGFGAEVKRRIMLGTYVLSSGYYDAFYLKAAKVRTLITNDFTAIFNTCDAILSPVAPTPAFKIGEKSNDPLQMYLSDIYTVSANLAGIPGISVPSNPGAGLPVGAQFLAPKWREDILLKLGFATQELVKSQASDAV